MRLRLTSLDEYQFLICVKHQVWGSKIARFGDWIIGDHLAFIVDRSLAGLARISGKPFRSSEPVWDNGLFPHRIPIELTHVMLRENRPPILGPIRDALISTWGTRYGLGILNQQIMPEHASEVIISAIESCHNDLADVRENLDRLLEEARDRRNALLANRQHRRSAAGKGVDTTTVVPEPFPEETRETESLHLRAQHALVQLGRITGCSVWIASNDQGRTHNGKALSEGCLGKLPNLGLSPEAVKRISFIDVLWLQHNAPICAFEIEATTSIYSGLLRMSDLLALVPALRMKLFIVAPKERQDRVRAELVRPTFQKIGLSEYCRFIAIEDLDRLLQKVQGFEGHLQPTVVDTVAIDFEELQSALD